MIQPVAQGPSLAPQRSWSAGPAAGAPASAPAPAGPQDTFTPSAEASEPAPVVLAQATDPAQRVIDTVDPLTNLPQFPGNPSMPYFPGEYNPTSPTGPAGLLNQVATPVNHQLGNALNPNARQDQEIVRHLLDRSLREHGNSQYMSREQAMALLQGRYGNLGEQRLNALLDNLADQTSNVGIFSRERSWIYADDVQRFLTNRRY